MLTIYLILCIVSFTGICSNFYICNIMATEFSKEEIDNLVSAFKQLKVKPKADTPEDLRNWMKTFTSSEPEVKKEPQEQTGNMVSHQTITIPQSPRLSNFHGDGKGGTAYEVWKYELQCLINDKLSDSAILQAVRSSLKGEASKVIMRLGVTASLTDIMTKMDSIYGDVDKTEMVLGKFYSARQNPGEDVSSWGCRLEDLLNLAISKDEVQLSDTNNMLRSMFWNGMQQSIKNITGHLFESIQDFDELRVAIRRVEQDCRHRTDEEKTKKTTPAKSAVASDQSSIDKLTGMINQLSTEVRLIREKQEQPNPSAYQPHPKSKQSYRRRQDYRGGQRHHTSGHHGAARPDIDDDDDIADEPTCWRCGQIGHLQNGCRVNLDHQRRKPLNAKKSALRGKR